MKLSQLLVEKPLTVTLPELGDLNLKYRPANLKGEVFADYMVFFAGAADGDADYAKINRAGVRFLAGMVTWTDLEGDDGGALEPNAELFEVFNFSQVAAIMSAIEADARKAENPTEPTEESSSVG